MSQFSRRARWLNALFPASVLPQKTDPGDVSDDVSLVQSYDGGGLGIPNPLTLTFRSEIFVGPAALTTPLIELTDNEIFRIMRVAWLFHAGLAAPVRLLVGAAGGAGATVLASTIDTPTFSGENVVFRQVPLVLGPAMTMFVNWSGGDFSTSFSFGVYGFRVPVGTVFQF